jgi:diguanylate cyclase (GGDEF)-like protein
VPAPTADPRLGVLTRLGHRLPGVQSPGKAAAELVRSLAPLGVSASVCAVESDQALVIAAHVMPLAAAGHPPATIVRQLLGTRIPIDRVPWLSRPVRLRRPYSGPSNHQEILSAMAADSGLTTVLAGVSDRVVAVPAMVRDRVIAVVLAWGPGCCDGLVPTLAAAAAMLAGAWEPDLGAHAARFAARTSVRPTPELRTELRALLDGDHLVAALQPVVRFLDRAVIGYEALIRFPPHALFSTPDELFAAATSVGMESAADLTCLRAALREAPNIAPADLFVNVLIGTLLRERHGLTALDDAVQAAGLDRSSVVLEFSERDPVPDLQRLQRIAARLRSSGYRIAVDDAGAGHASMQVIAELRPDFIKVDRALIHAIDSHRARRGLVVSLLSFSGHIGARLIVEGVETQRELETLLSLGVQYGQGWALGRPVLVHPMEGLGDDVVVDPGWFSRHRAARPRTPRATLSSSPAPVPEAAAAGGAPDLPRALSEAANALQSEHDPMRILGVMADRMSTVVPVAEMTIYLADYETHRFVPVLATGPERDALLAESFSMDSGITGWAFARGSPENVVDTWTHPHARQVPGTAVVQESLLLIPLIADDRKLGIINCYRLGVGRFSDADLKAASLFAHIAAAAWRNAQLYAELREAATTDALTGLYNNRWLREAAGRDLASSARDGTPLALLLLDLDHFKQVNDSAGHAAGDQVLQQLASRLRATLRVEDAVVRYGGEEFVVLLRRCDGVAATAVAEALRAAVRRVPLPAVCLLGELTTSIGIAVFPEDGADLDSLLRAADHAMYAAKHAGRDTARRASPADGAGTVVALAPRLLAAERRRRARPAPPGLQPAQGGPARSPAARPRLKSQ